MTEKQKMLAGQLYLASDPELAADRLRARSLTRQFNQSTETQGDLRRQLLQQLFGQVGPRVEIEPPFHCDYGYNIHAEDGLYMNFGCVILDVNTVHIGRNLMCGPYVQIYTAHHPLDAATRTAGPELGTPIRIGHNVWIGGGSIVLPGVTIGDNVVIGAGSVVTKDLPSNTLAVGNPCRVVKSV